MPNHDKAEKLKVNGQSWDRDPAQFIVKLSCQFGTATAGEHTDFKVGAKMTVKAGEDNYDLAGERGIQKVDGAVKDADNFIAVEPLRIEFVTGPSGKVMGSEVTVTEKITIDGEPGEPGETDPG